MTSSVKEIRVRAYAPSKPWSKRTKFVLPNFCWVLLIVAGLATAAVVGPSFLKTGVNVQGVTVAEKSAAIGDSFSASPMFATPDIVTMKTTFNGGYTGSVYLKLEVQGLPCSATTDSTLLVQFDSPPGGVITYVTQPSRDSAGVVCGVGSTGNAWYFDALLTQNVAGDYGMSLTWNGFPAGSVSYSVTPNA